MNERPIIFSGAMVRAILQGRKTQTRRILQPRPERVARGRRRTCPYGAPGDRLWVRETWHTRPEWDHLAPRDLPIGPIEHPRPARAIGHISHISHISPIGPISPRARPIDYAQYITYAATSNPAARHHGRTRAAIHLPRWASRITLEIISVRLEKLRDILPDDAISEGIDPAPRAHRASRTLWRDYTAPDAPPFINPVESYRTLWDTIHTPRHTWQKNPWVWVMEFRNS